MRRRIITKEALRSLYPDMDPRFERQMQGMIESLPARAQRRRGRMRLAVLAAALMLLAASALAVAAVQGLFESVAQIDLSSGVYVEWSRAEKQALFSVMAEHGELEDAQMLALMEDGRLTVWEERTLNELAAARYGRGGMLEMVTLQDIMDAELGLFDDEWPLDKKAAYSSLMDELGLLPGDTFYHMLPGEDTITPEQAQQIAIDTLAAFNGVDASELEIYRISYGEQGWDVGRLPPYYAIWVYFTGERPENAVANIFVGQDGSVLESDGQDGYHYVSSPQEQLDAMLALKKDDEEPLSARLDAHRAQLEAAETKAIMLDLPAHAEAVLPLSDGTALIVGSVFKGDHRAPLVLCIDVDGNTRFMTELPGVPAESGVARQAMQLENGEILLFVRRQATRGQDIVYMNYEQVRLSPSGEVLETIPLRTATEIFGMVDDLNFLITYPGHGGFIAFSSMGAKNVACFAQLNERGETVFSVQLDDLIGKAAYPYAAPDGYLLCAWDEGANTPILRRYDMEGTLLSECAGDAQLADIRTTDMFFEADGSFAATSHFTDGDTHLFAIIGADNKLIERREVSTDSGTVVDVSDVVRVGDAYVYASEHFVSPQDSTHHLGLIIADADGTLREVYPEGFDDGTTLDMLGIAAVGGDTVAVVANSWTDDAQGSYTEKQRRIRIGLVKVR